MNKFVLIFMLILGLFTFDAAAQSNMEKEVKECTVERMEKDDFFEKLFIPEVVRKRVHERNCTAKALRERRERRKRQN